MPRKPKPPLPKANILGQRQKGTARRYVLNGQEVSRRQYDKATAKAKVRTTFDRERLRDQRVAQGVYNRRVELARTETLRDRTTLKATDLDKQGNVKKSAAKRLLKVEDAHPFVKGFDPQTATEDEVKRQTKALEVRGLVDANKVNAFYIPGIPKSRRWRKSRPRGKR